MRFAMAAGKLRHLAGWRPDKPDHRDLLLATPQLMELPAKADLRPSMPPVFDQGQLGSCTANMGCNQFAFLEMRAGKQLVFSRLFLYAVTRQLEGTPLSDDSGAEIRDVMKALAKNGVCLDSLWPYSESQFSVEPSAAARADAATHEALFFYRCATLDQVKASIALHGYPIGFGFTVYESMMSDEAAQTGLVPFPQPNESTSGGHAVIACGYDDTIQVKGDVGGVICMNSWGVDWGMSGFFVLPYRYFLTGLADDMWTLRRASL